MRDFHLPGRSTVYATEGMCATSHPLAASVAVDILRRGGTAADAAIAGAVLLGICEPQMCGIGGDMFALIKPAASEDIQALNASGRAPAAFDAESLRQAGHALMPKTSPHAVTLPGAVAGFAVLSDRHGKLGLDALLAPAIAYCETGVPVAPRVARDWAGSEDRLQGAAREVFLHAGKPPKAGDLFRMPKLAEALKAIAKSGAEGFYTGDVAADLVAVLRATGGTHREEDFSAVRADWDTPIAGPYRGIEIVEHPPNGQGTAALLLADILAQFDIAGMDPHSLERLHIEAEAQKLAYDARNRFVADPQAMSDPGRLQRPGLAAELAALIDPDKAMDQTTRITESVHKDTIYITVVDRDRMAVSLIFSIFDTFGSGLASSRYGILLHNRGAGFSLEAGHPNEAAPGKRPMHTIIPGMLRDNGRVCMSFGVMGGQYQAAGHARLVSNLVDLGMDPQQAIDAPRMFVEDGALRLERGYDYALLEALAAKGHQVEVPDAPIGGAQAIRIDASGVLAGGSDPRKDGCALGY
ncbi:MAG: gamma-glutamyltransferase family protein [Pseudomonadota bacterium]